METYGLLLISSGHGGEEVGTARKQEGEKTQMGNEPVHLSWENIHFSHPGNSLAHGKICSFQLLCQKKK